jgi:UDP-N-acetylmuramyl pentapeptide phosphotransferase/UDP-N-acetylglucosamine-1-phosphate transferase
VIPILHPYGIPDIGGLLFISILFCATNIASPTGFLILEFYQYCIPMGLLILEVYCLYQYYFVLPILHPYGIPDIGGLLFISILFCATNIASLRDSLYWWLIIYINLLFRQNYCFDLKKFNKFETKPTVPAGLNIGSRQKLLTVKKNPVGMTYR